MQPPTHDFINPVLDDIVAVIAAIDATRIDPNDPAKYMFYNTLSTDVVSRSETVPDAEIPGGGRILIFVDYLGTLSEQQPGRHYRDKVRFGVWAYVDKPREGDVDQRTQATVQAELEVDIRRAIMENPKRPGSGVDVTDTVLGDSDTSPEAVQFIRGWLAITGHVIVHHSLK